LEPLPGIPHEDLLKLVFSFALLLGVARLFGELAVRLHFPAVAGEILAGVVLGPSLLSGMIPQLGRWLLPENALQAQLLDLVGLIGIMFLLVVVGLETDLALIRTRFRTAAAVGLAGLVVPFIAGLGVSLAFPDHLLVDPARRKVFALFLAVALALSAIPVLAKILADLGMMRSPFGQSTLAAGMIDDILGWTLLGIVTSLAAAGGVNPGNIAATVGAVALFLAATVLVARPLCRIGLRIVQERFGSRDMTITLLVVLAFGWGAFSHALHLEPILGAFAIGVIFGQMRRLPLEVGRRLESVTFGVLAPVFLATAGLRLSVDALLEPALLGLTVLLVGVAALSKLAGAYIGARYLAGTGAREAVGYGMALNARGVLGIIVAAIGLSMGILGVEVYSMVVVTSVVTSLMAPIGLKLVFGAEPVGEEPRETGALEAIHRVLLAVRPHDPVSDDVADEIRALEAAVLAKLGAESPAVTLLTVAETSGRRSAERYLARMSRLFSAETEVSRRVARGDPTRAILEEAAKGYNLIVMGASEPGDGSEHLFGSVVDEVVRLAPCPSMVFTARGGRWPPRAIMVPTGGGDAAARAAGLAFALATEETEVLLYHVIDPDLTTEMSTSRSASAAVRMEIGEGIVNELREVGEGDGVRVATEVAMGGPLLDNLVERAGRDIDLIILGTGVRAGSPRLFLGPKVERLLRESPCSVIVLNV
jgi:Kef-type K+ transport system membrane component KefB